MDKPELKPCPFCGFEKPFLTNCEYRKSMWTIRCPHCKIEITVPVFRQKWGNVYCGNEESNRERLIEAWNRRSDSKISVGDKVYQTDGFNTYESTVRRVLYDTEKITFDADAIGQSVFLTREEAEKRTMYLFDAATEVVKEWKS